MESIRPLEGGLSFSPVLPILFKKIWVTLKKDNQRLVMALVGALTLGLAPFFPEPHIVGKLRWLFGGGRGMGPEDGLDLLLHGIPWAYLLFVLVRRIKR